MKPEIINQVAAGIIVWRRTHDGPRFLLLYHGGRYWNFPKGKIEPKESLYEGALRELFEETGLTRVNLKLDPDFRTQDRYTFRENKKRIFKMAFYFLAESSEPHIKISKEHQGYAWFLYRDCVRMLMYQNLKNNLKKAYDTISRKSMESRGAHQERPSHDVSRSRPRHRFSSGGPRSGKRLE